MLAQPVASFARLMRAQAASGCASYGACTINGNHANSQEIYCLVLVNATKILPSELHDRRCRSSAWPSPMHQAVRLSPSCAVAANSSALELRFSSCLVRGLASS